MNNSNEICLPSDEYLDFVFSESTLFNKYLQANPEIRYTDLLSGGYRVGIATYPLIESLYQVVGVSSISIPVAYGLLDEKLTEPPIFTRGQNQIGLTGSGTIIAVIDTGIDYTLDVFRNPDGTSKIISIYDQTTDCIGPLNYFGVEYTREQINRALSSDDPWSIVPQKDENGHGTFLASIAAGSKVDDFIGVAPNAEIVAVKLRKAHPRLYRKYLIPEDNPYIYQDTSLMIAVEYCLRKAIEQRKPITIFLGLGTNMSIHTGATLFKEYISHIGATPGVCIITSAGNEAISKKHFSGHFTAQNQIIDIDINVEKVDNIYLTMFNNVPDSISISITSPAGESIGRIPSTANTVYSTQFANRQGSVTIEYIFPSKGSGTQNTIIKLIDAAPGIWKIAVYGDYIIDGEFHAWLPIKGMGAQHTTFVDPDPYNTIVDPGTSHHVITVGAYNTEDNTLYEKSSWGPLLFISVKPDFVAPGVNVPGVFPDGYGVMSGTAVATAYTAGICANILEWGIVRNNEPAMDTMQTRAYLIRGCIRSPELKYPNPQWGYGIIDLLNTFKVMLYSD